MPRRNVYYRYAAKARANAARYYREHQAQVRAYREKLKEKLFDPKFRESKKALAHAYYMRKRVLRPRPLLTAEQIQERRRAYRLAHAEGYRIATRKWRSNNRERLLASRRASEGKRRATWKERGSRSLISRFIARLRARRTAKCYYCGVKFPSRTLHFDHVHAIVMGGPHTLSNLAAACQPCNQSKFTRNVGEWQPNVPQHVLAL